ncbi:carboxymuconolactone decarboxylase family protein [Mycobacterium antarcticum]|uniref:carboxymuconolactone decarboxylase family protein n=1 Tax=Mycolicibacterium sp. TUM20984 TaxID=3023368 RepID=UPI0023902ED6|nr:carboxymuconolactone decarboxylase family protein [Mycolicibacterium sp. TUM20984]GLP80937.1 alkyl hydroperoxide reductase AhpD [Mycolicibacterium sp. TUM20984]
MTFATADQKTTDPSEIRARAMIRDAWGRVPNLGKVMALSLPFTQAVLDFDSALAAGSIDNPVGEQLAIAVANENRCTYCLAAHTAAARAYGVSSDDAAAARTGSASDPKVQAALKFAQALVRDRGSVTDSDLGAIRTAGWTDGQIVEILGLVVANILTNYLHHMTDVPVDYPAVEFAAPYDFAN